MKPSVVNQIASAKQDAGTPQKQFTREEIEKHNTNSDCWIVVDNKVYDATSVLEWHPGGTAAIVGHAGKVHAETSNEFESIHDDYAYKKLNGMYGNRSLKINANNARMYHWDCDRQSSSFHQARSRSNSQREGEIKQRIRSHHTTEA